MLRSRIIPCLLIHKNGLYKTLKFSNHKYVGDPINAVKIFNEKEVDEIMVIDIDASINKVEPNYNLIRKIAKECRMPLCYGGGIKTVEQAKRIINLGVEKIAISSIVIDNIKIIDDLAHIIGNQSIVVVIDVKKSNNFTYDIYYLNGRYRANFSFEDYLKILNEKQVGEIVINSIDNDGVMNGYDINLIEKVRDLTDVPITAIGGAGTYNDLKLLINKFNLIGAAAGSLFVFKGKFRAVLINYPNELEKKLLLNI